MTEARTLNQPQRAALTIDAHMHRREIEHVAGLLVVRIRVPVRFSDASGSGHEHADYCTENCRFHSASPNEQHP
jgi:hypothetical protein